MSQSLCLTTEPWLIQVSTAAHQQKGPKVARLVLAHTLCQLNNTVPQLLLNMRNTVHSCPERMMLYCQGSIYSHKTGGQDTQLAHAHSMSG